MHVVAFSNREVTGGSRRILCGRMSSACVGLSGKFSQATPCVCIATT